MAWPGGSSASACRTRRRSRAAGGRRTASDRAAIGRSASSRRPTSPGRRGRSSQARASTPQRLSSGPAVQASADVVGSHSGGIAIGLADQVRREQHLDQQRGGGLVGLRVARRPLQVAHAQATGAQHRGRVPAPGLEQQVGVAQQLQRRSGPGAVDRLSVPVPSRDLWPPDLHRAHRAVAAQRDPHLPGQLDGLDVDPRQQSLGDEPADRPVRVRRAPAATDRRARHERVQHPLLVGRDGLEQSGQIRGRGRSGRRAAEPARVRRSDLARGRDEGQRVLRAPGQRAVTQRRETRLQLVARDVRSEQPGDLVELGRLAVRPGDDQRLQHGERDRVQLFAGPLHRRPDAGPGRQDREVGRRGHGEVGAHPQQRGEGLVVLAAQPVDQGLLHRCPR